MEREQKRTEEGSIYIYFYINIFMASINIFLIFKQRHCPKSILHTDSKQMNIVCIINMVVFECAADAHHSPTMQWR